MKQGQLNDLQKVEKRMVHKNCCKNYQLASLEPEYSFLDKLANADMESCKKRSRNQALLLKETWAASKGVNTGVSWH